MTPPNTVSDEARSDVRTTAKGQRSRKPPPMFRTMANGWRSEKHGKRLLYWLVGFTIILIFWEAAARTCLAPLRVIPAP